MTNANDNGEPEVVSSLRDLPTVVQPPRDLWAGIEARIAAERAAADPEAGAANTTVSLGRNSRSAARDFSRLRWMAAAAVVAALAVGMWVGRSVLPITRPVTPPGGRMSATNTTPKTVDGAAALQAAYVVDPKYRKPGESRIEPGDDS
jgi:hypothetical protein